MTGNVDVPGRRKDRAIRKRTNLEGPREYYTGAEEKYITGAEELLHKKTPQRGKIKRSHSVLTYCPSVAATTSSFVAVSRSLSLGGFLWNTSNTILFVKFRKSSFLSWNFLRCAARWAQTKQKELHRRQGRRTSRISTTRNRRANWHGNNQKKKQKYLSYARKRTATPPLFPKKPPMPTPAELTATSLMCVAISLVTKTQSMTPTSTPDSTTSSRREEFAGIPWLMHCPILATHWLRRASPTGAPACVRSTFAPPSSTIS